jgi:hypothetical protein
MRVEAGFGQSVFPKTFSRFAMSVQSMLPSPFTPAAI